MSNKYSICFIIYEDLFGANQQILYKYNICLIFYCISKTMIRIHASIKQIHCLFDICTKCEDIKYLKIWNKYDICFVFYRNCLVEMQISNKCNICLIFLRHMNTLYPKNMIQIRYLFRIFRFILYKLIAILSRQYHIILRLVGRKYIPYWRSREATKPIRRIYFLPTPQYNVVLTAQNRN